MSEIEPSRGAPAIPGFDRHTTTMRVALIGLGRTAHRLESFPQTFAALDRPGVGVHFAPKLDRGTIRVASQTPDRKPALWRWQLYDHGLVFTREEDGSEVASIDHGEPVESIEWLSSAIDVARYGEDADGEPIA